MKCFICQKPVSRMNSHPVECDVHDLEHDLCGVCIPTMEKAGIIEFDPRDSKDRFLGHVLTTAHHGLCPSRELLASVRLSQEPEPSGLLFDSDEDRRRFLGL